MEAYSTKQLLDLDGKHAGTFRIELIKNRKKIFKRNNNIHYDYENCVVYCNDNILLGKIIYECKINENCTLHETRPFRAKTLAMPVPLPSALKTIDDGKFPFNLTPHKCLVLSLIHMYLSRQREGKETPDLAQFFFNATQV